MIFTFFFQKKFQTWNFLIFMISRNSKVLKTSRLPLETPDRKFQSFCKERKIEQLCPIFCNSTSLKIKLFGSPIKMKPNGICNGLQSYYCLKFLVKIDDGPFMQIDGDLMLH